MNHKILFLILTLGSLSAFAGIWKVEEKSVKIPSTLKNVKASRSDLVFRARDGRSFEYSPLEFPLAYSRSENFVLGGKTYFLTFWHMGAQSMRLRIFNPDASQQPLCEHHTDVNKSKLKLGRKGLEVSVALLKKDHAYEDKWLPCKPIVTK